MQTVMLGTLSLNGAAGVVAMRRKLLVVAQRLGFSAGRGTRVAASASDYAKTVVGKQPLEVRVSLTRASATQELWVDFLDATETPRKFLDLGFDRVEKLLDGEGRGWRGCCPLVEGKAVSDAIARCQAVIAEEGVDELVEALNANNQALQAAKEVAEEATRLKSDFLANMSRSAEKT